MDGRPQRDAILGCILGGALGDALGSAHEGGSAGTEIDTSQNWHLTDDTQLTLATCEAITEARQVDASVIAARFLFWFRARRLTGLGASTLKAMRELEAGGHWALVGAKGEMAAGNGAAMRIAPLAFLLDPADPAARRTIRDVSRITHHHDEAYCGALAVVTAVRAAWMGEWVADEGLISIAARHLPDSRLRDRLHEFAEHARALSLPAIAARWGCSGFVVESVPLALMGAEHGQRLGCESMFQELISLGGDVDTIASMAGQIMGCRVGVQALPANWIARLPERDEIVKIAGEFSDALFSH